MERRKRHTEIKVLGDYRERLSDAAGAPRRRNQDTVVRPHQYRAGAGDHDQVAAATADTRIDDGQMDRIGELPNAGCGDHSSLADVEWRHVVGQIDYPRLRACTEDHRVAYAYPGVTAAEVGSEADDGIHGPPSIRTACRGGIVGVRIAGRCI